jgi:hypothetical protein
MHLNTAKAPCPQCGGFPDYDEEGKAYTCYFCCDAGVVEAAVADAYDRALADQAEKFAPKRLGIFFRMPVSEWEEISDEEVAAEQVPGHRLFTGLWEIAQSLKHDRLATVLAMHCADAGVDDIPF